MVLQIPASFFGLQTILFVFQMSTALLPRVTYWVLWILFSRRDISTYIAEFAISLVIWLLPNIYQQQMFALSIYLHDQLNSLVPPANSSPLCLKTNHLFSPMLKNLLLAQVFLKELFFTTQDLFRTFFL